MTFVKVTKNKAYFKRYQVKYRRRREGKTDYRARKRLITQDKNKYNSPKYRLVVRITNKQVICQIAYSEIDGDKILAQATSKELPRYGLTFGLKNFSAAYATGLLVGRRVLAKLGLDEDYEGNTEPDGEIVKTEVNGRTYFVNEVADEKRPFRCYLDVGLRTTTTGHRVFGALKGAADAGLDIPHSEKRFPGYSRDDKSFDAEVLRDRIYGQHVADHMRELEEDDPEMLAKHYAEYQKAGIGADDIEDIFTKVFENIREDPSPAPKSSYQPDKKYKKQGKRSLQQRKGRVAQKKAYAASKAEE
jgi:large subunit ribosomal protein L5e